MLGGLIAGGLGALGGILGGGAQKKAAKKNMALLNGMKTEGMGYIDQGNDTAAGHLGAAVDKLGSNVSVTRSWPVVQKHPCSS